MNLGSSANFAFFLATNLRDEGDNKFVEAAIHTAAVIATYNVRDVRSPGLTPHGWTVMTPQEFRARYS